METSFQILPNFADIKLLYSRLFFENISPLKIIEYAWNKKKNRLNALILTVALDMTGAMITVIQKNI